MRLQFDLAIHSSNKNDLEYKINILYKVFKKGSQNQDFQTRKSSEKKMKAAMATNPNSSLRS